MTSTYKPGEEVCNFRWCVLATCTPCVAPIVLTADTLICLSAATCSCCHCCWSICCPAEHVDYVFPENRIWEWIERERHKSVTSYCDCQKNDRNCCDLCIYEPYAYTWTGKRIPPEQRQPPMQQMN